MPALPRRDALKMLGIGSAAAGSSAKDSVAQESSSNATSSLAVTHVSTWHACYDRVFLGGDYWANPMEDWRIDDGAAECTTTGDGRNLHLLTHQFTDASKSFETKVDMEVVEPGDSVGGGEIRLGVSSEINEYRSNLFAKSGFAAGIRGDRLVLGRKTSEPIDRLGRGIVTLHLSGAPVGDRKVQLQLRATDVEGSELGSLTQTVAGEKLLGNISLMYNRGESVDKDKSSRCRFSDWSVAGEAFSVNRERAFGPILWSMYSLSDSRSDEGFVMKLTALTGPMGEDDSHSVALRVQRDGGPWIEMGTADLDNDAWTATFRIANWDETSAAKYELVYQENRREGSPVESTWSGVIKANPSGRPLRMAGLTCQNDYAFPYQPVCDNLIRLDPDLLYFSGDQLYEGHGGFGLIRQPAEPAILNYLRKYYQHGMAFRDAMKNAPTICLADDHDVFQGNIWGEGGKPMNIEKGGASSNGGYIEPARMVNVVHRTNTSHHPDFHDPTPVLQGISVYYGDMVYGDVSFAILADRQWKSGPQNVDTGSGRADHVLDPEIDPTTFDKPGLVLLGERQEDFLEQWADDWRGHRMKVVLSQTVFAAVATHHGRSDGYLVADLDCGSWPQTPRNRAIRLMSKGKPLHINGDQHLTSLVQYGVDQHRDSCWSFCTPAIAAGYQRWWRADEVGIEHQNRPKHGLPHTGEYVDTLGNKAYVYAIGNPAVSRSKNRYEKAHEKASGFGLITIDTVEKTYKIDSFRFLIDATDGNPDSQFPGWPVTIHQDENGGMNRLS